MYHWGLIMVRYAWYLRNYDTYVAHIQCPYTNDYERVEARSKEELEQKIEETVSLISKNIRRKDGKR